MGVASWNLGLATDNAFRRDNKIATILEQTAEFLVEMLLTVDIVALNELHVAHQGQLNTLITFQSGVAFLGFESGDGICWRP